jgi:hypothetical protein
MSTEPSLWVVNCLIRRATTVVKLDIKQAAERLGISEQRGWQNNGHAQLFQAVRQLADETGDNQLVRLFQVSRFC